MIGCLNVVFIIYQSEWTKQEKSFSGQKNLLFRLVTKLNINHLLIKSDSKMFTFPKNTRPEGTIRAKAVSFRCSLLIWR